MYVQFNPGNITLPRHSNNNGYNKCYNMCMCNLMQVILICHVIQITMDIINTIISSCVIQCRQVRLVVLAATNRPNALDPALRRPGETLSRRIIMLSQFIIMLILFTFIIHICWHYLYYWHYLYLWWHCLQLIFKIIIYIIITVMLPTITLFIFILLTLVCNIMLTLFLIYY